MRELNKRPSAAFTPEMVEMLVAGFSDAWAIMKVADGVTPANMETKREELGRVAIQMALEGAVDRQQLCAASLAHFGIVNKNLSTVVCYTLDRA